MLYRAKAGDTPAKIARAYGVPFEALISANPRKPTTIVSNGNGPIRTWSGLLVNETIVVPVGGLVGDPASDVVDILVSAGGPCLKANAGYVCQIQSILGLKVDGKWGNDTATAVRALVPNAPGACSPTPNWWVKGASACPAGATAPASAPTSALTTTANGALSALNADPNYCTNVGRVGTAVNKAVHNFKGAWNAANPSNPVPIGTGKYEPSVAAALSSALGGLSVPPGCGATAAAPPPPVPPPPPAPIPTPAPIPAPEPAHVSVSTAPASVQALLGINPCDPSSVGVVCAAQHALGVSPDGKYGSDTAAAARHVLSGAPPGCDPRPPWWKPKGQSNCSGGPTPPPQPAPIPGPAPAPTPSPTPVPSPTAAAPAAVLMLATVNPCLQANVEVVRNAQRALGLTPDGKYGNDTMNAARRLGVSVPAACSPAPLWWGAKGVPAPPGPPAPTPGPSPAPGPLVTTEKKISTGAIIAGALGVAALAGLAVVALSGGKKHHRRAHKGAHKPHRKSHGHKPHKAHKSRRKSKRRHK